MGLTAKSSHGYYSGPAPLSPNGRSPQGDAAGCWRLRRAAYDLDEADDRDKSNVRRLVLGGSGGQPAGAGRSWPCREGGAVGRERAVQDGAVLYLLLQRAMERIGQIRGSRMARMRISSSGPADSLLSLCALHWAAPLG